MRIAKWVTPCFSLLMIFFKRRAGYVFALAHYGMDHAVMHCENLKYGLVRKRANARLNSNLLSVGEEKWPEEGGWAGNKKHYVQHDDQLRASLLLNIAYKDKIVLKKRLSTDHPELIKMLPAERMLPANRQPGTLQHSMNRVQPRQWHRLITRDSRSGIQRQVSVHWRGDEKSAVSCTLRQAFMPLQLSVVGHFCATTLSMLTRKLDRESGQVRNVTAFFIAGGQRSSVLRRDHSAVNPMDSPDRRQANLPGGVMEVFHV